MKTLLKSFLLSIAFATHLSAFAIPLNPCAITVNAGADKKICAGSSTVLDVVVTGGTAPYTYSWSASPGASVNSSTAENPVAYPAGSSGTNTYTVTVTDANNCTASDAVSVTVVPNTQLVPNGNFESVSGPPSLRGQIELAAPWIKATGDADLFDKDYTLCPGICGSTPLDYNCIGIPCNHFGFQNHRKPMQRKYAGLWAGIGKVAVYDPPSPQTLNIAVEAIEIPLTAQLVPGQSYRLSFYASKAEKGEVDLPQTNDIVAEYKIKLATTLTTNTSYQPVNAPVLASGTITDTTNWQKKVHIFTATTAATHLIIESYIDSLFMKKNLTFFASLDTFQSYFYIDDISLKFTCESDTVLHAFAGPDQNSCGGSVTLGGSPSAAAGTPPYNYSWSPGGSTSSNPSVSPPTGTTTYTLTVTDQNELSASDQATVTMSNMNYDIGPPYYIICSGTSTVIGGIPTGGIPPYTYSWTPAAGLSSTTVAQPTATPTTNTTYKVTVTDSIGCVVEDSIRFIVHPSPTADAGNDRTICEGTNTTLNGTVTGGTSPYIYRWRKAGEPVFSLSQSVVVAPTTTTTYVFETEDARGCSDTDTVVVTVNARPEINASDTGKCTGGSSVTIGSAATGGTGPYTYTWSHSLGNAATHTVNPSVTTTYTVTATDANGCVSETESITVKVHPLPGANANTDREVCPNGSVVIGGTHTGSGDGPFTYSWSPTTGLNDPTLAQPTASPSSTTTYTVTVTNSNGCQATDDIVVTVLSSCSGSGGGGVGGGCTYPVSDAGEDVTVCDGGSTIIGGSPTASGGTPGYTYLWTPSTGLSSTTVANPTVSGISRQLYKVLVTDNCGLTSQDIVTVTMTSPTVNAGPDRTVCATTATVIGNPATGGTPPYTYSWTASSGATPPPNAVVTVAPTTTTTYTVTVTDANGCQDDDAVTVFTDPAVAVDAGPDQNICYEESSVVIGNNATGGTPGFTYSWYPARGLSSTTVAMPSANPYVTTHYTVTVTDSRGCMASDNVSVFVNPAAYLYAGPDKVMCPGDTVTIGEPAELGTPPYTYSWSPTTGLSDPSAPQTDASPSTTTTYTLTTTDSKGCMANDDVVVTVKPAPVANAGPDTIICEGKCTTIGDTATGGTPPYTYSWSPPTGLSNPAVAMPDACPDTTTTYIVTVTGSNGCTDQDTVEVEVISLPIYIVNEGFELGTSPPLMRAEIEKAPDWMNATGDPDLFDRNYTTCSTICGLQPLDYNCVGAPCNHFGFQHPHQGSRYAGLWSAFKVVTSVSVGSVTRKDSIEIVEGIETELTQALDTAETYLLSFYISKAEKGEVGDNNPLVVSSCADYNVKFSTDFASNNLYQPVLRPVVHSGTVCDAINWQLETFIFQPADTFKYLIIESKSTNDLSITSGNTSSEIISNISSFSVSGVQAYFYIDDIHLEKLCGEIPATRVINPHPADPEPVLKKQRAFTEPLTMQIAPNPNAGTFTVTYILGEQSDRLPEIVLYDAMGKILVHQQLSYADAGSRTLEINPDNTSGELIPGIYFVRLSNGQQTVIKRVSVIR